MSKNVSKNVSQNESINSPSLGFYYSFLAGSCAALASVFGKIALDSSVVEKIFKLFSFFLLSLENNSTFHTAITLVFRVVCFGMIFIMNGFMWTFFVKSMHYWSTLNATVMNSSFNYFLTAVIGNLLFSEPLSSRWWFGSSLILLGLFFISLGSDEKESKNNE